MAEPPCILVLDDSETVLLATAGMLEPVGYRVVVFTKTAPFLVALATEHPALALVDVEMPEFGGSAVVWIARAHAVHTCPIVLYSSKSAAELEPLVASSGADGYIRKTSHADHLAAQVGAFIKQGPKP